MTTWQLPDVVREHVRRVEPVVGFEVWRKVCLFAGAVSKARAQGEGLPEPWVEPGEEGELVIEWCLPRCRLGISFEAKASESGWWYVDLRPGHETLKSGHLDTFDPVALVRSMVG